MLAKNQIEKNLRNITETNHVLFLNTLKEVAPPRIPITNRKALNCPFM